MLGCAPWLTSITARGSLTSLHYDGAGRLDSLVTTLPSGVMSFAYERNENGNITAENSIRYTYDDLNRLTAWYDPATDATTNYTYDADYNLTSAVRNGATLKKFSFDAAERISNVGYAYDDNGNLTSDGTNTYAYDALNRLSSVTGPSGATVARYTYDALNRRTSATNASGTTTYFHYDGAGANVIAETDGAGHTLATYAWAGGSPISMTRGGRTFYYHVNAHGDVLALTDSDGNVVASYSYDPWGNPLSATGNVENPYRYAGYRFDSATGLYYLLNRYYSPAQSRFITRDLLAGDTKAPATMNHYAYCLGDPVNRVDPSGLVSQSVLDSELDAANHRANAEFCEKAAHICELGAAAYFALAAGIELAPVVVGTLAYYGVLGSAGAGAFSWAMGAAGIGAAGAAGAELLSAEQSLQGAAQRAQRTVGSEGGQPVLGTLTHSEFERQVNALGRSDLFTEQSYAPGMGLVRRGSPGSVRLDVVEGPDPMHPTAVYDLKTGESGLSAARIAQIRAALPDGYKNIPIKVIRP
jgi:RHS repeat-associated protein